MQGIFELMRGLNIELLLKKKHFSQLHFLKIQFPFDLKRLFDVF